MSSRIEEIREEINFPFIPDNVEELITRLDSRDNREVGRLARKEEEKGEFSMGIIGAVKKAIQTRNKADGPSRPASEARMDRMLRERDSSGKATPRKFR